MQSRGEQDYNTQEYYNTSGSMEYTNTSESLKAEVEDLKTQVEQYKFVSKSFEKRVLDLQMEMIKKDEEIRDLKEKYEKCLAGSGPGHVEEVEESEMMRKLFVGGLNQSTTDEMLQDYFSKYGTILNAVVMKDAITKKSRGFGFVMFASSTMLDAVQADRPHTVDDKAVDTKRAVPKGTVSTAKGSLVQSKRIFIGGLRATTGEGPILEYFSRFGQVESVSVLGDKNTNRNRGFAYVTFSDSDTADKAVLQKYHTIDSRRCEVKPAISKVNMHKEGLGNPDPGVMGNFPGMMGPHSPPGNMPGFFPGNFPGHAGGNGQPMYSHMDHHHHMMEPSHQHCCSPPGGYGHGCGMSGPGRFGANMESGGCNHCGHSDHVPVHNPGGPGASHGRAGQGGGWNNGSGSISPASLNPGAAGFERNERGGLASGRRANSMGGGDGGTSTTNYHGDPGAGRPIRNTGHYLQRGSTPY